MSGTQAVSPTKIALVTGASNGIGRAAALSLNEAGWTVILTARRKDALEETVKMMGEKRAEKTTIVVGDLSKPEFVEALFDIVSRDFGRLDLFFNVLSQNAGVPAPKKPFEELPLDDFQYVMDVNVTAAYYAAQEAYKIMKNQVPQGGRIINNGSISAYTPRPLGCPYTMSKHAITGMTKTIALEGRAYNIACSQVDIGNAATNMSSGKGDGVLQANGEMMSEPGFDAKHVGDSIAHMASLPLNVTILFQTIMASAMPYVGRG